MRITAIVIALLLQASLAVAQTAPPDPYRGSQAGTWQFERQTGERGEAICLMSLRDTNPEQGPARIDLTQRAGRRPILLIGFVRPGLPTPAQGTDQVRIGWAGGDASDLAVLTLPVDGARRMGADGNGPLVMHSVIQTDDLLRQIADRAAATTILLVTLPNAQPVALRSNGFGAAWQQAGACMAAG
ncbi:MAG TPA: hypothetical protein VGM87_06620 [Roseomonas sp.]|jgi:hypothetical protein